MRIRVETAREFIYVNYYYNHGGSQRIFEFKPFQSLDIKIQKPFFNERLSVDIGAKDIFRKLKYEENAQFNNIRFYQIENYSSWNFFIDIIYRFNQQKVQYRSKSAAQDEINRL